MLTRRMYKKAARVQRQLEGPLNVPRDHLPESYYARRGIEAEELRMRMDKRIKKDLEKKAKELLIWKITKKGEAPNPFENVRERSKLIKYMIEKGYVLKIGERYSLDYPVTPEGKRWAMGK